MTTHFLDKKNTAYCILLVALIWLSNSNLFFADFISWDDADFTYNNNDVKDFNVKAFFSKFYLGNYAPLTMVSFAFDYFFNGENPLLYHLHNIALHTVISICVLVLFNKIQTNKHVSFFVALLFALHPMQTESIAWISERKNLVCGFFYILTLVAYVNYINTNNSRNYFFSLLFFVLALFSKGMAVSIPFSMLAIDLWVKRKLTKPVLLEKIPFFILSIIFGIVAIKAQSSASFLKTPEDFSFLQKLLLSGYAYMQYALKLVFPVGLSAIYPYPKTYLNIYFIIGTIFFIVSLLLLVYGFLKEKNLLAGSIIFFSGNIIFVLQFIKQGAVLMADHYVYIACLGLFFPFCYVLFRKFKNNNFPIIICTTIVLFYCGATYLRNNVWKNSITFWKEVVRKYPNSEIAQSSLGAEFMRISDNVNAAACFNKAIAINPRYYKTYYNKGLLLAKNNQLNEAIADFTQAIKEGNYLKPMVSRAEAYFILKDYQKAISDAETVLKKEPDNIGANYVLGNCYSGLNKLDEALYYYNKCISLNPKEAAFFFKRAIVSGKQQKFNECMSDLNHSIELNPRYGEAYYWRGVAKVNLHQNPCQDLKTAFNLGYIPARDAFYKYCN